MATIALLLESDGPGGAERMLLALAEELRWRGHAVVPVGPACGCGWLAAEFRAFGFEPERFELRRPLDGRCARGLVQLFRTRRVDVVHSHEFTMAVYGAVAARRAGLPHVITMHGGDYFAGRWRRRLALRWAVGRSRATVAVSEAVRARLEDALGLGRGTVRVVPNGIAFRPGRRAPVRAELGLGPGELLIVAIGNLYPVKGHAVLLEALASLAAGGGLPPWRLAVAGRGEEEARLRALAAARGLEARVHLLGHRADVPDLLAAADLYAMPSLSEGLPLALLEAMFAGKPIVASDLPGIREAVVPGEDALLVPPGDAAALAAALRRLLLDPVRRRALAGSARRRAEACFTADRMADAYEALYRAV